MFKAILFDLDGTLLNIDMNLFLTHYFREVADHCKTWGLNPHEIINRVWTGSNAMISNKDPGLTNQMVFERAFIEGDERPMEFYQEFFTRFYSERFDRLRSFARAFPEAPGVVQKAFNLGTRVVIATNPIFPVQAIFKRLEWAGIHDYSYHLVTSYETMHFTKPHVEYYEEICSLLDVRPEDCLMVGNDVAEDLAARQLGMKTFLVKDCLINEQGLEVETDWEGYLPDLDRFLKELAR